MRRKIVRLFAAAGVAVAAIVGMSGVDAVHAEELPVSGTLTGIGGVVFEPCPFVGVTHQIAGELTGLGAVSVDLLECSTGPADPNDPRMWPITSGSFSLTAADGSLTGSVSGSVDTNPDDVFEQYATITITGGTGRYLDATGTLTVDTEIRDLVAAPGETGKSTAEVSGQVVLPPSSVVALARTADRTQVGVAVSRADDGSLQGFVTAVAGRNRFFSMQPTRLTGGSDSAVVAATGSWGRASGHTIEVSLTDSPDGDQASVVVHNPAGEVVFEGGGAVTAGVVRIQA